MVMIEFNQFHRPTFVGRSDSSYDSVPQGELHGRSRRHQAKDRTQDTQTMLRELRKQGRN
jgi:hypothetical protein